MFVLDSHSDTPSQIIRGRDLSGGNDFGHVDFPKLKQGEVDGVFFALYLPAKLDSDPILALQYAQKLLFATKEAVSKLSENLIFATNCASAHKNKADGKVSIFLGLENGAPLSPKNDWKKILHDFYDEGVRYVTLCHTGNNEICDSCAQAVPRWNGLSPFGREVVAEMNKLGMLVDVSHISDAAFYDVLECSIKPVVATHSCCRALADHPRNMTDDMIRALAAKGGVIQINFYPVFLDSKFAKELNGSELMERGEVVETEYIRDPLNPEKRKAWATVQKELQSMERPSYKLIADHIDHVVSLVGVDHVGVGSDYDGIAVTPEGMEDISMMPKLFAELRAREYSESDLSKIASGNFFRILG
jgi:membrane dipeptidase